MNEQKMSLKEALKMIAKGIGEIQVPVALADQISRPLCRHVSLLQSVIDQMEDKAPEAEQEGGADV